MIIEFVDLTKVNIEIVLQSINIDIQTVGVQGASGQSSDVIRDTYINTTVTNQTYLVCKGDNDLIITLKNTVDAVPVTIVNATNGKLVTVQCSDGQTILGHTGWNIMAGNVFGFLPQGDEYYVD